MKYTKLIKLAAIALFSISASCGDHDHDHDKEHGHDHSDGDHKHSDKEHAHIDKDHKDHDHSNPEHDHSKCNIEVGPNGGRLVNGVAELILNNDGKLTLAFIKTPSPDTQVILLMDSEPLTLTQNGNSYTTPIIAPKLPADVHVSIKNAENKFVEKILVIAGKCTDCNNAELACTCHNHDHGDHGHDKHSADKDEHQHDHSDHGHDH